MYFHAVEQIKAGREKVGCRAGAAGRGRAPHHALYTLLSVRPPAARHVRPSLRMRIPCAAPLPYSGPACPRREPQAVLNAMFPTPLGATGLTNHTGGRMAGHHTWWSYRSVFSAKNIAMEVRPCRGAAERGKGGASGGRGAGAVLAY